MERIGFVVTVERADLKELAESDRNVEFLLRRWENGTVTLDARVAHGVWYPVARQGKQVNV